ncbi:hypothetical protein [Citreimonas sp.]|uniref:hypothetical protein n=1 Tax=Citreimonas sp. TaxID=3036715 RepID=UPI004058C192
MLPNLIGVLAIACGAIAAILLTTESAYGLAVAALLGGLSSGAVLLTLGRIADTLDDIRSHTKPKP